MKLLGPGCAANITRIRLWTFHLQCQLLISMSTVGHKIQMHVKFKTSTYSKCLWTPKYFGLVKMILDNAIIIFSLKGIQEKKSVTYCLQLIFRLNPLPSSAKSNEKSVRQKLCKTAYISDALYEFFFSTNFQKNPNFFWNSWA